MMFDSNFWSAWQQTARAAAERKAAAMRAAGATNEQILVDTFGLQIAAGGDNLRETDDLRTALNVLGLTKDDVARGVTLTGVTIRPDNGLELLTVPAPSSVASSGASSAASSSPASSGLWWVLGAAAVVGGAILWKRGRR